MEVLIQRTDNEQIELFHFHYFIHRLAILLVMTNIVFENPLFFCCHTSITPSSRTIGAGKSILQIFDISSNKLNLHFHKSQALFCFQSFYKRWLVLTNWTTNRSWSLNILRTLIFETMKHQRGMTTHGRASCINVVLILSIFSPWREIC
jgi:hypothetical protein